MVALRTIKPLNEPQPIMVKANQYGKPEQVRMRALEGFAGPRRRYPGRRARPNVRVLRSDGEWIAVSSIEYRWKIKDEWWRGPELEIERIYFDVILKSNQRVTIFHDLVRDTWFRQAE